MPRKINEYALLPLLRHYILQVKKGKHLQANGKRIRSGSINNYEYLEKLLGKFQIEKQFELRIRLLNGNKLVFETEKKYWKNFHKRFTDFLYDDLDHYDNYVSSTLKLLRTFFNYLRKEKGYDIGEFHKKFVTASEEIEIIVLSPERLNFLIRSEEFNNSLSLTLRKLKDTFVFGCVVGLRHSDLMQLSYANLERMGDHMYLKVRSKKTQTFTNIKLPPYAIEIIERYKDNKKRLLPYFNKWFFNKKLKELGEKAGWTEMLIKTRQKRGIPVQVYKTKRSRSSYRFCDLLSSHTMRRTSITTMLCLGMNEHAVRKISGHAAGSKEFFRYVSYAQAYVDDQIDLVHQKLVNI